MFFGVGSLIKGKKNFFGGKIDLGQRSSDMSVSKSPRILEKLSEISLT